MYVYILIPIANLVVCVDASRGSKESRKEGEDEDKQIETLNSPKENSSQYRVYEIGVGSDEKFCNKKSAKMKNKYVRSFFFHEFVLQLMFFSKI
jgi:hypothetical protein